LGPGHAAAVKPLQPSAYWGDEQIWDTKANNHNSMLDKKGRVWLAAGIRGFDNPAFCKKGSDHPSAKVFPLERSSRHAAVLDPKPKWSEIYNMPKQGYGIRGGDIDKNGVAWGSASNGSLVSFDRRKCKGPLNGPTATGDHCPEGWAFYRYPGPSFEGETTSVEASYYTWADQHNTLGLGENIPMSTANLNDGFVALKDGQMVS